MILISQDRTSICNTFNFTISFSDASGMYEIVNKLDGHIYGSYRFSTCKKVIHDIFEDFGRFPDGTYRFPEYDD